MSNNDDFLTYLYQGQNRAAYETALALVNEIADLKKQLAEAKAKDPAPYVITKPDFDLMISMSVREYVNRSFPITVGRQSIPHGQEPYVFMIEAFIALLNKHELLRKQVTFDYRR